MFSHIFFPGTRFCCCYKLKTECSPLLCNFPSCIFHIDLVSQLQDGHKVWHSFGMSTIWSEKLLHMFSWSTDTKQQILIFKCHALFANWALKTCLPYFKHSFFLFNIHDILDSLLSACHYVNICYFLAEENYMDEVYHIPMDCNSKISFPLWNNINHLISKIVNIWVGKKL